MLEQGIYVSQFKLSCYLIDKPYLLDFCMVLFLTPLFCDSPAYDTTSSEISGCNVSVSIILM